MGGRGSSSKLASHGGGGVPGVAGGGSGGTGVDGSGGFVGGGSAGGSPNHEMGATGRDMRDQRGLQETNGMAGSNVNAKKEPRGHIDGGGLTYEEKVTQVMVDTGWSEQKAQSFIEVVKYYSDGNSREFCGSADKANFMFGDRPDDSKLMSEGILAMPPYEGELWRGITISSGAAEEWLDEMYTGDIFGFAGYYTGPDMADSFSYWSPGDMRDAGVVASFTSDRDVAFHDYANLELNGNGTIIGDRGGKYTKTTSNTTIIFHLTGNKTAASITHLAIAGADESEVLSPIWQQFEYEGKTLIRVLPNGHEVYQVELIDKGIKPKDRGPVR